MAGMLYSVNSEWDVGREAAIKTLVHRLLSVYCPPSTHANTPKTISIDFLEKEQLEMKKRAVAYGRVPYEYLVKSSKGRKF